MEKLIVDMDDVITEKGFIRMINEFLGTKYKEKDAKSYYINDLIPKDRMDEWVDFYLRENVYDYANIVKGAKETLEKLNEKYDLYIATAYVFRDAPWVSGKTLCDKYNFLIKNFPFIDPHKFIFISNKELLEADIRIDDSPKKLLGKARLKLLFTAYHNKDMSDEELKENNFVRVNGWKECKSKWLERSRRNFTKIININKSRLACFYFFV